MSRVGKAPVTIAKGLKISITPENEVVVQGAKWTQKVLMRKEISAKVDGEKIVLTRMPLLACLLALLSLSI
jgi:large subunit ribosomal protein L6